MAEEQDQTTLEDPEVTETPEEGAEEPQKPSEEKPDRKTDPDRVVASDDWRQKARKHEAALKRERKQREDLEKRLKDREDADKSEQDKAVDAAREEGRTAALAEAQKERRQDRLEVAATRLAAKGIPVGEGDDAKTLKFADPDDALVHVERAIRAGDVDEDDIYDQDNKVKPDGLKAALQEILERKPHLVAKPPEAERPRGSSDAGKGSDTSKTLEEMSPDDHLKQIQGK